MRGDDSSFSRLPNETRLKESPGLFPGLDQHSESARMDCKQGCCAPTAYKATIIMAAVVLQKAVVWLQAGVSSR